MCLKGFIKKGWCGHPHSLSLNRCFPNRGHHHTTVARRMALAAGWCGGMGNPLMGSSYMLRLRPSTFRTSLKDECAKGQQYGVLRQTVRLQLGWYADGEVSQKVSCRSGSPPCMGLVIEGKTLPLSMQRGRVSNQVGVDRSRTKTTKFDEGRTKWKRRERVSVVCSVA
jgi:hypothetical protein